MVGCLPRDSACRATVTPPGPEQTPLAWPAGSERDVPDQCRFDLVQQSAPEDASPSSLEAGGGQPETPHVRMLPVILGVILGAGLLVGLTLGVTWLIARGSHDGAAAAPFSVSAGDCVKRNGEQAVTAELRRRGLVSEVTAIVDTKEQCPDPGQPHVARAIVARRAAPARARRAQNPTTTADQVLPRRKPRG